MPGKNWQHLTYSFGVRAEQTYRHVETLLYKYRLLIIKGKPETERADMKKTVSYLFFLALLTVVFYRGTTSGGTSHQEVEWTE